MQNLEIALQTLGTGPHLTLKGEVDATGGKILAGSFERMFQENLHRMVVDLEGVTGMDEIGVCVLAAAIEKANRVRGEVVLVNPPPGIRHTLGFLGYPAAGRAEMIGRARLPDRPRPTPVPVPESPPGSAPGQVPDRSPRRVSNGFRFANNFSELGRMDDFLRRELGPAGLQPSIRERIILAVNEASAHILMHAYGQGQEDVLSLTLEVTPRRVQAVIRYAGKPCLLPENDRTGLQRKIRPGEAASLEGHLVHALMDEVESTFREGAGNEFRGNELRLAKML